MRGDDSGNMQRVVGEIVKYWWCVFTLPGSNRIYMPTQTGEVQLEAECKAFLLAERMYPSQFHYFKAKEFKTNKQQQQKLE